MKLNELIKKYKKLEGVWNAEGAELARQIFLQDLEQLDESEIGYADEAPRYVKNILARLRELPLHDREVWLKAIMSEFEQDFSRAKWREGYEQGKIEGMVEREKVKVPRFVADWIEVCKEHLTTSLYTAMTPNFMKENNQSFDLILWIKKASNQDLFARAWLDGYEVEKEKRYLVKIKGNIKENMLVYGELLERYFFTKSFSLDDAIYSHTRKELENAKIGWVFDCEGFEIEEVE
ncbi:phage protein [Streptococcus pneumoniae]|nr:phage protein [Streptococcus pneumoniae]VQF08725.1 phage protein [Streptococcus pneumoniae]